MFCTLMKRENFKCIQTQLRAFIVTGELFSICVHTLCNSSVKYCTCTSFFKTNIKKMEEFIFYFLMVVCLFVGYTRVCLLNFMVPFFDGACRFSRQKLFHYYNKTMFDSKFEQSCFKETVCIPVQVYCFSILVLIK